MRRKEEASKDKAKQHSTPKCIHVVECPPCLHNIMYTCPPSACEVGGGGGGGVVVGVVVGVGMGGGGGGGGGELTRVGPLCW